MVVRVVGGWGVSLLAVCDCAVRCRSKGVAETCPRVHAPARRGGAGPDRVGGCGRRGEHGIAERRVCMSMWCRGGGNGSTRKGSRARGPAAVGSAAAVPAEVVAGVKAMACEPPEQRGVPLSRWSSAELAAQAWPRGWWRRCRRRRCAAGWPRTRSSRGGTGPGSSPVTLTSPRRPPGCWTSTSGSGTASTLGADDYVITADEKSQLQALSRCHPPWPRAGPGRRVEFEYERRGTLAYFGAYDVHRAALIGTDRAHDRDRAVHRTGRQGHDDGALRLGPAGVLGRRQRLESHNGQRSMDRMSEAWPTARWCTCRSTPRGSTRSRSCSPSSNAKSSSPPTSPTWTPSAHRLTASSPLQHHRRPFDWRFTRADLHALLRTPRHAPARPDAPSPPRPAARDRRR